MNYLRPGGRNPACQQGHRLPLGKRGEIGRQRQTGPPDPAQEDQRPAGQTGYGGAAIEAGCPGPAKRCTKNRFLAGIGWLLMFFLVFNLNFFGKKSIIACDFVAEWRFY